MEVVPPPKASNVQPAPTGPILTGPPLEAARSPDGGAAWAALEEGIAVCDPRGVLIFYNPSLPRLLGIDAGAFQQHPPSPLCSVGVRESGERFSDETDPLLLTLRTGVPLTRVLVRVRPAAGQEIWLSVNCRPLFSADGLEPHGVVASFTDVTQQRLAGEALREGEARFRSLADSAPVLIWVTDSDGRLVYVNRRWTELTGRPAGAERDDGWTASIHPEDREGSLRAFYGAIAARQPFALEMRLRRSDGVYRWTLHHGTPRVDSGGAVTGFIVSGVDIDVRRRNEARQAAMLAATRVFVEAIHLEEAVPRLLDAIGRGLGYEYAEFWHLAGTSASREHWWRRHSEQEADTATDPAERAGLSAGTIIGQVLQSGTAVLKEGHRSGAGADGTARTEAVIAVPVYASAEVRGVLLFRTTGDHALAEDLRVLADLAARLGQFLDHRQADASAQRAEALRAAILDGVPARLALLDERGVVLAINRAWGGPAGIPRTPLHAVAVGTNYLQALERGGAVTPESRAAAAGILHVMAGHVPTFELEYAVAQVSPAEWFRMIVTPLAREAGAGAVVMHVDISASKRAEEVLSASEVRYRLLSRVTSDVIYDWDLVRDRVEWSEGLGRILGYDHADPSAAWWLARIHPEDRGRIGRSIKEAENGNAETWVELYRFCRADGTYVTLADRGYLVRDDHGRAVRMIGAMSDITHRRAAEDRVRRSEAALSAAQAVAQLGSWEWDLRSGTAMWSTEQYRMLGLPAESGPTSLTRLLAYVHPGDRARVEQQLDAVVREGSSFDVEFRLIRPDGAVRHVHARGHVVRMENDIPVTAIGAVQDVTELREAERNLREREERLRLLNNIVGAVRQTMTVPQVIAEAVSQLHRYLPTLRVSYSTIDPDARARVLVCRAPGVLEDLTGHLWDLAQAPELLARLKDGGTVVLAEIDGDPMLERYRAGRTLGTASALAVGLQHAGPLVGMLSLGSAEPRAWTDHEQAMLREVADWLSVRIGEARAQEEREQAVRELESSREQLRELAHRLQSAREEERTRVAREIHDTLGQLLTAIYMEAGLLVRRPELLGRGESLLRLIDGTTAAVQRLAADLRPSQLDDLGLHAAIEWEVERFQERSGVRCTCQLERPETTLTPEQSTAVFRVLQEALTNVARHSEANRVDVILRGGADHVILDVGDNGVGIPEAALQSPVSLGLVGMRERAVALGGRLEIHSQSGRGSVLSLVLPLSPAPERIPG